MTIRSGIHWPLIFPPIIGKDIEVGTWPIAEIAEIAGKKNRHNHKKRKTAAIADFSS